MTTLIAAYNSDGLIGRCDARCYNAKDEKCTCICNGMNHGGGKNKAIDNTKKYSETWLEKYKSEKDFKVILPELQQSLF